MNLKSREQELRQVYRYKGSPCNPMFYRPNLWIHAQRVEWLSQEIATSLGLSETQIQDVVKLARYHDDSEIITGDILAMDKGNFSKDQREQHKNNCDNAVAILVENYSQELGDDYSGYLHILENVGKNFSQEKILEQTIVNYADKLDANMEITHELYAGNDMFAIMLTDFGLDVDPYDYTRNKMFRLKKEIVELASADISALSIPLFEIDTPLNVLEVVKNGVPHNIESISKSSGHNLYDIWKNLHFKYGNEETIAYLYTQQES